ncbi:MAG: hypothetical protein WAS54_07330 [Scrofimicrobium sp.]
MTESIEGFGRTEREGDQFTIFDLTPEAHWGDKLGPEDHEWLASIAELKSEDFLLNAGTDADHSFEREPVLVRDIDGWRASRYVGEIRHQGRTLVIRPRLGVDTIASWISAILNVQVLPHTASRSTEVSSMVTQLLAALWRAEVLSASQHALLRTPSKVNTNGVSIRGRLDAQGTVRRRASGHRDLVSSQVVRTHDNAPARAVVLADRYLDERIAGGRWRGPRLDEQLTVLRRETGTKPRKPTLNEIRKTKYSPITAKWRRAAELSWRIIENDPLGVSAIEESTHGVLIDVAELWERFVLHCIGVVSSRPVRHGAVGHELGSLGESSVRPDTRLGRLYPDVVVGTDPVLTLVDAKYKRLSRGISREDLYQLHAYASTFLPKTAALAYPLIPWEASEVACEERYSPWRTRGGQDLSFWTLPVNEKECVEKLKLLIPEA